MILMEPVAFDGKKITHRCDCGAEKTNVYADDDNDQLLSDLYEVKGV